MRIATDWTGESSSSSPGPKRLEMLGATALGVLGFCDWISGLRLVLRVLLLSACCRCRCRRRHFVFAFVEFRCAFPVLQMNRKFRICSFLWWIRQSHWKKKKNNGDIWLKSNFNRNQNLHIRINICVHGQRGIQRNKRTSHWYIPLMQVERLERHFDCSMTLRQQMMGLMLVFVVALLLHLVELQKWWINEKVSIRMKHIKLNHSRWRGRRGWLAHLRDTGSPLLIALNCNPRRYSSKRRWYSPFGSHLVRSRAYCVG